MTLQVGVLAEDIFVRFVAEKYGARGAMLTSIGNGMVEETMVKEWIELTTEEKIPRLTIDQRPTWLPLIRDRGRLRIIVLGHWWSPWTLLALAVVGAGVVALLRLLARIK